MQHLGQTFFDDTLNQETLIWSQECSRSFKDSETQLSDKLMQDPYIQYYIQRNPGYTQGDRLMCMAPLDKNTIPQVVQLSAKRLWKTLKK
jgi:urease accessory protein UreH